MTIKAGEFKAKCLRLMDRVKETRESITITKRGVPVAKLVPAEEEKQKSLFGRLGGCVTFEKDIVAPLEEGWDAAEEGPGVG
jgi:prevent-host-death family protein